MNKDKSTKRLDLIILIASVVVIGVCVVWMIGTGVFNITLTEDTKLSWHLVRSSGIVAYVLLTGSTLWGLFISAQFVKDWSPGVVSMTLHSTISWLALVLGLIHALLLLLDDYFSYTLGDLFVPFTGPYRPEAVGLGTLAFWLIVLVTLSFPFKKRLGHAVWKKLHYASYAAFGIVSLHGVFAGTEGTNLGLRLLIGAGVLLVVLLLGIRMGKDHEKAPHPAARKNAAP
ncbi:MAG: ferric reductase-like transmembrane domain-containing protein [Anaerolineae bacterium]